MGTVKSSFMGNPFIGMFAKANDSMVIIPAGSDEKFEISAKTLADNVIKMSIDSSPFIGMYFAMNSNGIVVPPFFSENELKILKKIDSKIEIIEDSRFGALGNNIVCNDNGAIVNEDMPKKIRNKIEDALDVEVIARKINEYDTVGMMAVATNKGWIAHNRITDEDAKEFDEIFKVKGLNGTINGAVAFVGVGIVANSKAAMIGSTTTGYEVSRVEEALQLM